MKKVPRLRITQDDFPVVSNAVEQAVRTTGRIKKPKAVFDPSDNYLPRSQRVSIAAYSNTSSTHTAPAGNANERKREVSQDSQQHHPVSKRLSQSSGTSMGTNSTTSLSDASDVCVVCLKREAKRGIFAKNKLISCLECEKRTHRMCLKTDFEDLDMLRQNFKCESCRTCELCDAFADVGSKNNADLLTCAKCVKSYHHTCHIPNIQKFQLIPKNWKCNKCTLPTNGNGNIVPLNIREIIGDDPKPVKLQQALTQPQAKPQQRSINIAAAAAEAKPAASLKLTINAAESNGLVDDHSITTCSLQNKQKLEVTEESSSLASNLRYSLKESIDIPDVKDWSVEQVSEFFAKYFPNEAKVFQEHEIDGASLLLLKRSDLIKKLPMKLGPSLRIYNLILKIQTQLNDATLGWNCEI